MTNSDQRPPGAGSRQSAWKLPATPVPLDPPQLLPGKSAYERRKKLWLAPTLGFSGCAGIAGCALLHVAAGVQVPVPIWVIVFGLTFSGSVVIFVLGVPWGAAKDRERRAGYTTLFGFSNTVDLWQLDYRSGEVLRRPGQERMTEKQWTEQRTPMTDPHTESTEQ